MELEERLNRRFNYRHFQQDNIPSKELINEILQKTIDVVPIKNEGWHFKLEAWGPEHYDEKRELAIITIAKREHMFGRRDESGGLFFVDEDEWYENVTKLYEYEEQNNWKPKDRNLTYFNNQVRAPYLVSVVLAPNTWNPNDEPVWDVLNSFMAGMFTYGVSVVANEYGVDCAFCSCFARGLKKHLNYITTRHDTEWQNVGCKSNCLTLIGLGYYDFFGKKKIGSTGSIYDTEKRIKIGTKKTKPKLENVIEWK